MPQAVASTVCIWLDDDVSAQADHLELRDANLETPEPTGTDRRFPSGQRLLLVSSGYGLIGVPFHQRRSASSRKIAK